MHVTDSLHMLTHTRAKDYDYIALPRLKRTKTVSPLLTITW